MHMSHRWQNFTSVPKAQEKGKIKKISPNPASFKSSAQKRLKDTNEYSASSFF